MPQAPAGATIYTFESLSFVRLLAGDGAPWFGSNAEYTQDLVKDSDQDYLDIGATAYAPLTIRAIVYSASERNALQALVGTTAVLANSRARSQDATLISASPIELGLAGYYVFDLIFVRRPTGS